MGGRIYAMFVPKVGVDYAHLSAALEQCESRGKGTVEFGDHLVKSLVTGEVYLEAHIDDDFAASCLGIDVKSFGFLGASVSMPVGEMRSELVDKIEDVHLNRAYTPTEPFLGTR